MEAKQEKRMCNEEMWQTENPAKLGKNGRPGATKVHLQLLLLQLIALLTYFRGKKTIVKCDPV